ncbi:tRNA (guanosine(46)-N7)-methyltransferase TrmB [Buchnera aphidicola]|uniref:tRNA (guanosine(46)-N7)-methyltransferase TrmB n=1 Tax=Buchnera aphidicola TaxID=9 RepID=UPI0031B7F393
MRKIYSFKRRYRSLKNNSIILMKKFFPLYGVYFKHKGELLNNFFLKKKLPLIIEIGFGDGENILYSAIKNKNYNFFGIEVYLPGVKNFIKHTCLLNNYLSNIKIIVHDAVEVFQYMLFNKTVSVVQLFFPDPWPKNKHKKRRIIQPSFINLLSNKLIYNGIFHIKTDCVEYYNYIMKTMKKIDCFVNISHYYNFELIMNKNLITKFEKKAYDNKKKIFNIIFQCII